MFKSFKDLIVYQKAFRLAIEIFHLSKGFPKPACPACQSLVGRDELYSLTDQIRQSSRSVCSNIAEGYCKRQYNPYFISKIFTIPARRFPANRLTVNGQGRQGFGRRESGLIWKTVKPPDVIGGLILHWHVNISQKIFIII
ncbi:MAG: four helix bundle protein [Candidatus Cloacimonetes bacterium]|nr:four helix bundle protein [Candidatus Cloacimonadota bacterium]